MTPTGTSWEAAWLRIALPAAICLAALFIAAKARGAGPEGQWQRGKSAFQTHCTNGCHRADLQAGAVAPALSGPTFLQHWQGLGANELFDRIRTTMPQQQPRSLDDQAYVDILAFILHENGVPTGGTELQSDADMLSGISIKPTH